VRDNDRMNADQPIVVAVDGSERDADALALGAHLAGLLQKRIIVAHAHPYQSVGDLVGDGEAEQALRSLVERVTDHAAGLARGAKVDMRLLSDRSPARALHGLAENHQATMIVVGASERGRVGLIRPGSTAERILQGSPCPVAVASAGYADTGTETLARIGCGFDGEPQAEAALARAVALSAAAHAKLRVIAVYEPVAFGHFVPTAPADLTSINEAARVALADRLREAVGALKDIDVESALLDGEPGTVLAGESESLDLLVVGSRGYGPLRSLLVGGVSGHVIPTASCPLLVCPVEA
jgi:nucleotide-binding universal stress UspA family protein